MTNQENTCLCCHNHCPLSAPRCEKGENYAKYGTVETGHGKQKHGHNKQGMPDLNSTSGLLSACGHALHHRNFGNADLFEALSDAEREELDRMLKKLLNSWEDKGHEPKFWEL